MTFTECLDSGEERGDRFPDAGRCCCKQPSLGGDRPVYSTGKAVLSGPVFRIRETQFCNAAVALNLPFGGEPRPRSIQAKGFRQKIFQFQRGKGTAVPDNFIRVDLIICQLNRDVMKIVVSTPESGVALRLSPVKRIEILSQFFCRSSSRLDLINNISAVLLDDPVRTAFQMVFDPVNDAHAFQLDLRPVVCTCGFLQLPVDAAAFIGTVKSGKAAVDAAAAQYKFNEPAHGQFHRHSLHLPETILRLVYHFFLCFQSPAPEEASSLARMHTFSIFSGISAAE